MKNVRDAIELGNLAAKSGDGHTVVQTSVLRCLILAASMLVGVVGVLRGAVAEEERKPEGERLRWYSGAITFLANVDAKLELDRGPGPGPGPGVKP